MSDDQTAQQATNVNVRIIHAAKPPGCAALIIVGVLLMVALSGWKGLLFVAGIVALGIYLGMRRRH